MEKKIKKLLSKIEQFEPLKQFLSGSLKQNLEDFEVKSLELSKSSKETILFIDLLVKENKQSILDVELQYSSKMNRILMKIWDYRSNGYFIEPKKIKINISKTKKYREQEKMWTNFHSSLSANYTGLQEIGVFEVMERDCRHELVAKMQMIDILREAGVDDLTIGLAVGRDFKYLLD